MESKDLNYITTRFLKGSKKAFNQLFDLYWEKLFATAFSKLQDYDLAEELVQNLFVEIWEKRSQIDIKTSIQNYLFASLKYKIFRVINNQSKFDGLAEYKMQNVNQVDEYIDFTELQDLLESSISILPEKCQIIFKLRKLEDKSVKEISLELNLSESTINNQLTKANKIVRENLAKVYSLSSLTIFLIS